MPNAMAALPNIGGANEQQKFRNSRPCPSRMQYDTISDI